METKLSISKERQAKLVEIKNLVFNELQSVIDERKNLVLDDAGCLIDEGLLELEDEYGSIFEELDYVCDEFDCNDVKKLPNVFKKDPETGEAKPVGFVSVVSSPTNFEKFGCVWVTDHAHMAMAPDNTLSFLRRSQQIIDAGYIVRMGGLRYERV